MKIKIYADAGRRTRKAWDKPPQCGYTHFEFEYLKKIDAIEGMILDVDTKFLFDDQFNTFPIPGITELGLRIHDYQVEEVIDDVRG